MNKTGMTRSIALGASALLLSVPVLTMLTGCDSAKSLLGNSGIGETLLTTKHSDASDRENYTLVEDIDGNAYTTVIYIAQVDDTKLDTDALKTQLTELNINWYQFIASSSMGTTAQEYCYLYFPASATYTDVSWAVDALNATGLYTSNLLNETDYLAYAENVNQYDFSKNETTYYGPASQSESTSSETTTSETESTEAVE